MKGKLGVIGGMGPEATAYYYEELTAHTEAKKDQDHIDMVILSHASIPDRTDAILKGKEEEVVEILRQDAKLLESLGVACIGVPCNTSHYFLEEVQKSVSVPIIHMVRKSVEYALRDAKVGDCIGIMATDGTIQSRLYHKECEALGLKPVALEEENQKKLMRLIYDEIKGGTKIHREKFDAGISELREKGCVKIILACTELSVFKKREGVPSICLDAMDVLVEESIRLTGYSYQ